MMMSALIIKNRLRLIIFSVLLMTFTSVTAYAIEERFTFSDLTATDKKTGLTWTRDANIAKEGMTWESAFKFIEKLNKQKYAGYSDWRLPTIEALQTLTNYANSQGYRHIYQLFNKTGFRNVEGYYYWSSSTHGLSTRGAWLVSMGIGDVVSYYKNSTLYVWPVRGGK